ncbi:MAG: hypothetical protein PVG53_01915 [Holophagae bacterium]|jgi:hypothetical protein
MALTMLLFALGGLVGFVAWIWLVVAAFRVGSGWGVVMLLLSWTVIPVIIFAIRNWDLARRPVALVVAGLIVNLVASVVAFSVVGIELGSVVADTKVPGSIPAENESPPELLPPPRPTAQPTHPSWEAVVEEMDRDTGNNWESFVPSPTPVDPRSAILSWDQAATRIGRTVVVELANSTTVTAVLEAVEPDRIRVRHTIGGGEASYWIERNQVVAIRRPD